MKIATRNFGELEIEDDKIIKFPDGLIGFPEAREFCLLAEEQIRPYQWLQCISLPELAFVIVPIIGIRSDYRLQMTSVDWDLVKLKKGEDPLILVIVVMADEVEKISANLLAPLVINEPARIGAQVVNDNQGYSSRHYIKEEMQKYAREGKENVGTDAKEKTVLDVGK